MIDKKTLRSPELLTKKEIEQLLPILDLVVDWAKQVQTWALDKAIAGEKFEGYKIVEGRSNRRFVDKVKVEEALLGSGLDDEDIYSKELKTLTDLERNLGKIKFNALLGGLVEKPAGKPTLVADSDRRVEFNSAALDFSEFID